MPFGLGLKKPINSAFSPLKILGCVLWLRADQGVTSSSGSVSAWLDQSSNAYNFTPINADPSYFTSGGAKNTPYLAFDAFAYLRTLTAVVQGSSCTIFMVQQFIDMVNPYISFGSGSGGNGIAIGINLTANTEKDVTDVAHFTDADINNSATTSWEQWTVTGSSAPLQTLRINGAARTLTPNNSTITAATTQTNIGAFGGSTEANVNIAEIICYNNVLSASNILITEAYLNGRYGI